MQAECESVKPDLQRRADAAAEGVCRPGLEAAIAAGATEPISMITVRLPRSIHRRLAEEAYHAKTSLNRLCISKLVEALEAQANAAVAERNQ